MKKTNKVVVNKCYGAAWVEVWVAKYLGLENSWEFDRTDSRLISLIEEFGTETCSSSGSALTVVTLPEGVTDWRIWSYDGAETVIFVKDGKLHTDSEL